MRRFAFLLAQPPRIKPDGGFEGSNYVSASEVYHDIIEEAVLLEELGYDGLWLPEHHFVANYCLVPNPLTLLAAVATRTNRLRLGCGVTVIGLHHPIRVAEEIAMLDIVSRGRVETSFGRGSCPDEWPGFDIEWSESSARMAEGLDVLVKLLTESDVEHEGKTWRFPRITLVPRPVQFPHPPFWLACGSANTIGIALDRGMHVVINVGVYGMARLREFRERFLQECEIRGLDPAQLRFGVQAWTHFAPTSARIEKGADAARMVIRAMSRRQEGRHQVRNGFIDLTVVDPALERTHDVDHAHAATGEPSTEEIVDANLIGDEEEIRAKIEIFKEIGATDLFFIFDNGDITTEERRESMRKVASILDTMAEEEAPVGVR